MRIPMKKPSNIEIPSRVTENEMIEFRRHHLSPDSILYILEGSVQVLYRLGIGVGKSTAVDGLLRHPATFQRFDLVLYAAPAWDILNERTIIKGVDEAPVAWTVLKPRPVERCGDYAAPWEEMTRCGCSALGKATLCKECQRDHQDADSCFWPEQFDKLSGYRLIFSTEQQLVLNRSLVALLKMKTGAGRVLVILDEARLLDVSFEVILRAKRLERFRNVLQGAHRSSTIFNQWCKGIDLLLDAPVGDIHGLDVDFPAVLNKAAYRIQKRGIQQYGKGFHYIGYDLSLFSFSHQEAKWKDRHGGIHYTARPYLNCHLLILSAHLGASYTGHRLGRGAIASPYGRTQFLHTRSRILNLRNRIGADAYFYKNQSQILDTFAVLILRNIILDRSTLLISRKKSKE